MYPGWTQRARASARARALFDLCVSSSGPVLLGTAKRAPLRSGLFSVGRIGTRMRLLAHTPPRTFLVYEAQLRERRVAIEDVVTAITVIDRGSWGELRFSTRD